MRRPTEPFRYGPRDVAGAGPTSAVARGVAARPPAARAAAPALAVLALAACAPAALTQAVAPALGAEAPAVGRPPVPVLAWGLSAGLLAWCVATVLAPGVAALLRDAGQIASNHRGRPVPCGAGFLIPLATLAGVVVLLLSGAVPGRAVWPLAAGTCALGLAGAVDDFTARGEPKGWVGHARALWQGRLTAGTYKALTGLVVAVLVGFAGTGAGGAVATCLGANAVNSVDTRPGRAVLALLAGSAALGVWAGPSALVPLAPLIGAAIGLWPGEGRERFMWGDAGANAAGFALGYAWALAGPSPAWAFGLCAAAVVVLGDRISLGRLHLRAASRNRRGGVARRGRPAG